MTRCNINVSTEEVIVPPFTSKKLKKKRKCRNKVIFVDRGDIWAVESSFIINNYWTKPKPEMTRLTRVQ